MLITRLGTNRTQLLIALAALTDEQINRPGDGERWNVAQIVGHIATYETRIANDILAALGGPGTAAPERSVDTLRADLVKLHREPPPAAEYTTRAALVRALEESRFRHLQRVFNETHEQELARRSIDHAHLGPITLKNLVDLIWLHDEYHLPEIEGQAHEQSTH